MRPYALLADIGGTNARFALQQTADASFTHMRTFSCKDYPTIVAAVRAYLEHEQQDLPLYGSLAIANPVQGDQLQMTNHSWSFSIEATRRELGLERLFFWNDFVALALSLPTLPAHELHQLGGEAVQPLGVKGLLGPGTGFGVAGLVHTGKKWQALASEGGHVLYPPSDIEELELLSILMDDCRILSVEQLLSGSLGLPRLLQGMAILRGEDAPVWDAAEIVRQAQQQHPLALAVIQRFCAMLGNVAGNLALTLGSSGGIYLGGGILPRLGNLLFDSAFRTKFEDKDRTAHLVRPIPCFLITAAYPAIHGAAAALKQKDL